MELSIERLIEAAVYVDDLAQAANFYGGVLGLESLGVQEGRHRFFRVGPGVLLVFLPEATQEAAGVPAHGAHGAGHIALGIPADDYPAWKERLVQRGVAIEKEVVWPRGGRSLYVRDPAGNSIELITPNCWGLPSGW